MNRKQITILLVLVVLLGAAGLVLRNRQSASWSETKSAAGKKLLGTLPVNDIAQVSIHQGTNTATLVKKEDLWRVKERNDYPANFSELSDFLMKAKDWKIVQSEKVGPSQLSRFALVPEGTNPALVVEFKDQTGKLIQSFIAGKKHVRKSSNAAPSPFGDSDEGFPDGRYVKVGGSSDEVALISDPLSNVEPKPEQWLNKDFLKVEKVRSIEVTFPVATNSWKVSRETEGGEWKLADAKPGEQLDSSKTSALSNPLSSASFNDVVVNPDLAALGLDKPSVIKLETFDHFSYTLKVGVKTNENYPVTVSVSAELPKERTPGKDEKQEDKTRLDKEFKDSQTKLQDKLAQEKALEKWTYLVSNWTLEPIMKERSHLLVEKKDEKKDEKAEAPGAAEVTNSPAEKK